MLGLDMLDVAVGVIVIYLFLSLAASAIQEMIESALKHRASDLERGIKELLQGDTNLVQKFYEHPLVAGLYPGGYKKAGKDLPSYIPAKTFAMAFLDIVGDPAMAAKKVTDATAQLPIPPKLKSVLDQFVNMTGEDIDARRKHVEDWFNGSMDRVSGWYKRRTHVRMIVVGALMAVLLNVDSIFIVKHLTTDRKTRDALVNVATETAKNKEMLDDTSPAKDRVDKYIGEIQKFGLPVGWSRITLPPKPADAAGWFRLVWEWFIRVLGWGLTALAVSLGAPFWFDTLNKVMVIRSTVKPTEKSKDEASEDRQVKPKAA